MKQPKTMHIDIIYNPIPMKEISNMIHNLPLFIKTLICKGDTDELESMNPDVKAASETIQKMIEIKLGKKIEVFIQEELELQKQIQEELEKQNQGE